MKFPKHNPFHQPPACWQMQFRVPLMAALAVEEAFADDALAVSSFEDQGDPEWWTVQVLLDGAPEVSAVRERLKLLEERLELKIDDPEVTEVENRDWLSAVARDFPPLFIGRFFVHGSHAKHLRPVNAMPIMVEAGTAFGSGEHATTSGCLLAIDRLAKRINAGRVLDVGCGSGILAIAAAKCWPRADVVAVDLDPVSVRVAQSNMKLNAVAQQVSTHIADGYEHEAVKQGAPYDLILANILARPLIKLAPKLAVHLRPGGYAILSGLLATQEREVFAAHRAQKLRLKGRIVQNGWCTLMLKK